MLRFIIENKITHLRLNLREEVMGMTTNQASLKAQK